MDAHPWHQHPLVGMGMQFNDRDSGKICQVCMRPFYIKELRVLSWILPRSINYRCKDGCDYYVHHECYSLIQDLKCKGQVRHPLHPQHHLTLHLDDSDSTVRKFDCSFCTQTTESQFFFHCTSLCDFYLHIDCSTAFMHYPELLSHFHIQHFLHYPNDIKHRLSPYIRNSKIDSFGNSCKLCRQGIIWFGVEEILTFKCITCDVYFYLHVQCSQIPQQLSEQSHHPQHPLTLVPYSLASTESDVTLSCHGCQRSSNKDTFVLHCTRCSNFILHVQCAFPKKTTRYKVHIHPLARFEEIHSDDDVLCSACNTPCEEDSFRCIPCNFNLHFQCMSLLSLTLHDVDVHVHPLTLTLPGKKDKRGHYYCDICETKRDKKHGVYSCEECPFDAHFHCALPKEHALMLQGYFPQTLEDCAQILSMEDDEPTTILRGLHSKVRKLEKVVDKLIKKEKQGEQLREKLNEIYERKANIEAIVEQLKKNL